ncbi:carbohydrate ABC transporter permease [uncultured Sphaerochaeta sp.]|uniref:carbohydrate ABC transporter permease n=1 Tax=uncultured Sphaerochaeta sp. TaxID=886478 RepID=UPI002A0A287B|nr:carbohydrate ABC transporter permease [uncultured Sphaerochaeta sp.]
MREYKTRSNLVFTLLVNLVMILTLFACLVPFVYMIALSLSSPKAIVNNEVFLIPKGLTLESYRQIFSYPNFFHAYGNTILYTVAGTAISLVMMVLFAYPLSKSRLRGNTVIMKLVIFSMFFSGGLIPNYLLVSSLHLINTRWAMLLPFAINQFNLILMINFFKAIPLDLEEAAIIDGLDYFGVLQRIILPLSGAALATVGLYTAVFFWNDWFNGLIYLKSTQFPVMLFLRNIVNGTSMVGDAAGAGDKTTIAISIKSAVIITSTLPIIVLYPFLQRFFVKGVMIGAVKG